MTTLVLLRHAEAEPKDARADFDRRLTDAGRQQAVRVGEALAREGIRPDRIVSSPANRALETAVLAAPALGYDIQHIATEASVYEAGAVGLLEVVRRHAKGVSCLVLVGHNPGLRELGIALDSLQESWSLPKGHAAVFASAGDAVDEGAFRHVRDVAPAPG